MPKHNKKKDFKILMFGWEFPPYNFGGLGTACYGLTKSLSKKGLKITFVVPKGFYTHQHLNIIPVSDLHIENKKIKITYIDSLILPYITEFDYKREYDLYYNNLLINQTNISELYGRNLYEEVIRFAEKAAVIAKFEDFDIIHCHDWLTFKAGIVSKNISGKPLIVHIHATDFDRTGGHPNQIVYDIEKEGMEKADKIIAVSNYTKEMIIKHYFINPEKIYVVHNGIDKKNYNSKKKIYHEKNIKKELNMLNENLDEKVVLFLGRLTLQKGPDYFIEAAKKVLKIMPNVKFIVAGTGDMYKKMIDKAISLGLSKNVLFTGHLTGEDIDRAYQMADLYVMPSVSEPFGITPLEALKNQTPILISKQSGVSEVITNALKVDFWDIDEMTNKIIGALNYSKISETMIENTNIELEKLSWDNAAEKCINVYNQII